MTERIKRQRLLWQFVAGSAVVILIKKHNKKMWQEKARERRIIKQ